MVSSLPSQGADLLVMGSCPALRHAVALSLPRGESRRQASVLDRFPRVLALEGED